MPTITDELHGDSLYGVAMAVYTLANMVALVAAGEMADRKGPTLPYVLSIATFLVGLTVAAVAPTMVWIVVGRTLQGAGTGGFAASRRRHGGLPGLRARHDRRARVRLLRRLG